MWKSLRPQLGSRLLFALIGSATCLLLAGALDLLFLGVDMQGLLADQSARSLLFSQGAVRRSTQDHLKTGDIQITLRWHNRNDLDLSCVDPNGEEVFCNNMRSASGGELDLDMNTARGLASLEPVENIHWPWNSAPKGHYRVYVTFFAQYGGPNPTKFEGETRVEGHVQRFAGAAASFGPRKQVVAEFDVTHDPHTFFGIHPGILLAALVVGAWFGLLAALLALALIIAENLWYRRHYRKPILEVTVAARRVGLAFVVAFGCSALCQLVFGVVANRLSTPWMVTHHLASPWIVLVRLLGWTLCFTVIGAYLSRLVPNMSSQTAPPVSLVVGWVGGVGFLLASQPGAEIAARLFGAALFGFVLGFLICLLWEEEALPVETMPILTLPPMRLQPYRMTINHIERVGQPKPETAGKKPPLVPHEKPI